MKIQFCIVAFFLLSAASALGQDSVATVSRHKYSHIDVGAGYLGTDLSSINRSLTGQGYKSINENFLTFSVSWSFTINRFLVRSEASLARPNQVTQADYIHTRFGGYSFGFGAGYAVIQKPKFRLYPFVGLNSFVNRLNFEDQTPVTDIDDVYNNPHRSFSLIFSNASLDVGIQIEKIFEAKKDKWDCPQNGKFRTLGVRMGYNIGTSDIRGRYNGGNQLLENAPVYSLKGPYIKVAVGIGTKARNLKWKH